MIFIYDKLIATLIATSVLIIFMSVQRRMTEVNIEQTMTYIGRIDAIETGRWIRQDLLNVGGGLGDDPVNFLGPKAGGTTEDGPGLIFEYQADSAGVLLNVSYTVEEVLEGGSPKTAIVNSDTLNLYKVVRRSNGKRVGETPESITYFEIHSIDSNGNYRDEPADFADEANWPKSIVYSFSILKPSSEHQYIPETHWGTTVPID